MQSSSSPKLKEQVEEPQEAKNMDVDVSEEEADAKVPKGDAMSTEGIDPGEVAALVLFLSILDRGCGIADLHPLRFAREFIHL